MEISVKTSKKESTCAVAPGLTSCPGKGWRLTKVIVTKPEMDGTEVRGHIEYYDTDMIKITRPEGPHFFVRKSDIRYIIESG